MIFFSLFVISAVILGAAAMLAPAWPTAAPRIGLTATLLLGLISGGAVWWANLFGWDTLIIDYLLFGIVSGVILGGTMSQGRGDSGWPNRADLVFLGLAALICAMPLFILRLPLGEQAASDALITLSVRETGSFTSLSPFYPEITGFAPPAFHALAAYLSQQLRQEIPNIHMALGTLIAFLSVWTVYDLGAEIRDKALGRGMAIALVASFGLLGLLWGSYYSQLMGVLFTFAFITYALRYYRQHNLVDMVAAGLMLGAVLYCSLMLFAFCILSFYFAIFFIRIPVQKPAKLIEWSIYTRIGLLLGIVAICLLGTGVWIAKNWYYLNWTYLAIVSDYYTLSDDRGTWFLGLYAISATMIGGYGLAWFTKRFELSRFAYALIVSGLLGIIGTILYLDNTLQESVTENDVVAFQWIATNTPENTLILNHPHNVIWLLQAREIYASSAWMTSFTARNSIFPPKLTCFFSCARETDNFVFWESPASSKALLYRYGIDYVLVPDGLDFPHEIDGLRLVFEQGGARVYEVIHGE